ncbi:MAG: ABC transporter permease [Acidimicrobiales bacterium]
MVAIDEAEEEKGRPSRRSMAAPDMAATPDQALAGLDRLDSYVPARPDRRRRAWAVVWPKVAAGALAVAVWQVVVWSGWRPRTILPGPATVARAMATDGGVLVSGALTTLGRAVEGYLVALVAGTLVAVAVTRLRVLRLAVGPLVTGLQAMPSVAWVPLAILLFGLSPRAVLAVTVIGSAPALAVGAIAGIDSVPPTLQRAGQVLGATGWRRYWYVVLPGALPAYVTGMKLGWAFAWRSVMAAELLDQVSGHQALGRLLADYQHQVRPADMLGVLVTILAIGLLMDTLLFGRLERAVLARRGLGQPAA